MENNKPVLIVIAGPNGAGKTTITEQLLKHQWGEDCEYINPDIIAKEKFGDSLLEERRSIVFETVLSSEEKIDYVCKARALGYFVRVFYVATESPAINAARIAARYMDGGHTVPIEKIVSRYFKSITNCARILSVADRVYLYDNSINNSQAKLLFRTAEGKLVRQYEADLPLWARPLLAKVL